MNSRTQRPLLILLLAFALPVILAKLVLSFELYQGGATNKGQLLPANLGYQQLGLDNPLPGRWQVLYLIPANCDELCQERLYILQQSHTALGAEMDRVDTLIFINRESDTGAPLNNDFHRVTLDKPLVAENPLQQQMLVIVDPLGAWVLAYPGVVDHQSQLLQGKALVSDLRKLLKLSRVG